MNNTMKRRGSNTQYQYWRALAIILIFLCVFVFIGCPAPGDFNDHVWLENFAHEIDIPSSDAVHMLSIEYMNVSENFSIKLIGEMNNSIFPGDSIETTIDPESGLYISLDESTDGLILSVIAKPHLYPEGTFTADSTYGVSISAEIPPLLVAAVFFDTDGAEISRDDSVIINHM